MVKVSDILLLLVVAGDIILQEHSKVIGIYQLVEK
jgi:hypothetical protein